jgi:hypothetical protein
MNCNYLKNYNKNNISEVVIQRSWAYWDFKMSKFVTDLLSPF